MSKIQADIMNALTRVTQRSAQLVLDSPIGIIAVNHYPHEGQATLVTAGLSEHLYTMWRGKNSGFELTLTLQKVEYGDWVSELCNIGLESIGLRTSKQRRPHVEYNGIYAPGYPPHFFFCQQLSQTPELVGRQKVGAQYAEWLPAIPISDTELRIYDRDVRELIRVLSQKNLTVWPRE